MLAAAMALKDAGLDEWNDKRNIGIIISTFYGCYHTDVKYFHTVSPEAGSASSPHLFAYTLPTTFLGDISIHFGLTGPSFAVHEEPPRGLISMNLAFDLLLEGDSDQLLVGICDTPYFNLPGIWNLKDPFALFVVMQKQIRPSTKSYGVMDIRGIEDVQIEGEKVSDLFQLFRFCLNHSRIHFKNQDIG
jgi:3-oxoacyl-[acyl-carrier-protein] synthase II